MSDTHEYRETKTGRESRKLRSHAEEGKHLKKKKKVKKIPQEKEVSRGNREVTFTSQQEKAVIRHEEAQTPGKGTDEKKENSTLRGKELDGALKRTVQNVNYSAFEAPH